MMSLIQALLLFLSFSIVASSVTCPFPEDAFMLDLYELLIGNLSPIQDPFGKALIQMSNGMHSNLIILAYFMRKNFKLVVEWARHNPMSAMILVAGCVRMYTDYMAQTKADEEL